MFKYFNFISTGTYSGYYQDGTSGTNFDVIGSICSPGDIVKFNDLNWNNSYTLTFLNNLHISNVTESEWTPQLKESWITAYIKYIGLGTLSNTDFNLILQKAEDINLFYQLSNPSIAYVNQDLVTNEISISLNVYDLRFVIDLGNTLPNNSTFRNSIYLNHTPDLALVSNVCKVEYLGQVEYVWCFDGMVYDGYIPSEVPSLINGGGNIFGTVKMAGNGIATKYIVKKNIDLMDPTMGICSGEGGPFCMGDEIHLIDTSVWTTNNFGTGGTSWTWVGDYSQFKYQWDIADITNPCVDYRNYSPSDMRFPIRAIQFCTFGDFSYNIEYFYYPTNNVEDIIIRVNEIVFWYPTNLITISNQDDINGYYATDWVVVSKGTDENATNNRNDSNHYRLRKSGFDNTIPFSNANYKVYRSF